MMANTIIYAFALKKPSSKTNKTPTYISCKKKNVIKCFKRTQFLHFYGRIL